MAASNFLRLASSALAALRAFSSRALVPASLASIAATRFGKAAISSSSLRISLSAIWNSRSFSMSGSIGRLASDNDFNTSKQRSVGIQVSFGEDGRQFMLGTEACIGAEHGAPGGHNRRKVHQADWPRDVIEDRFHPPAPHVSLMPESGPAGVLEKRFPPLTMRVGPGPRKQGIEVFPVLAHAEMEREERVDNGLV